jgi:antitoxin component YwqK of YwqJK toxin-antitoxin module
MSQGNRCQAFTKNGKGPRCKKNAVSEEFYCEQHLKMYGSQKVKFSKLPKKSKKLPLALIPDITKNILSEYLEYEEAKELEPQNLNIYANPKRIEIKEEFFPSGRLRNRKTYIDGDLRKLELWYENGNKFGEQNYKNGKNEGKSYGWGSSGVKQYEMNYKNNLQEGKQYFFDSKGLLHQVENYINGTEDGIRYNYYPDQTVKSEENYKNGKMEGEQYHYSQNRKIESILNYKNGEQDGEQYYFDRFEQVEQISTYSDGYYIKTKMF